MKNKEEYLEFVSSESYKHQIDVWKRTYNINRHKKDLFYDFLISLYEMIDNTFLGIDIVHTEIDQRNHFTWCWNKVIENFERKNLF